MTGCHVCTARRGSSGPREAESGQSGSNAARKPCSRRARGPCGHIVRRKPELAGPAVQYCIDKTGRDVLILRGLNPRDPRTGIMFIEGSRGRRAPPATARAKWLLTTSVDRAYLATASLHHCAVSFGHDALTFVDDAIRALRRGHADAARYCAQGADRLSRRASWWKARGGGAGPMFALPAAKTEVESCGAMAVELERWTNGCGSDQDRTETSVADIQLWPDTGG